MATIAIPLTTLTVGAHLLGPVAVSTTDTQAVLTIDRTAGAAPLNGQPASTKITILIEFSVDGGTTYAYSIYAEAIGGTYSDAQDGQQNSLTIGGSLPGGSKATHVRGTVTVIGASVSVSGSLQTN